MEFVDKFCVFCGDPIPKPDTSKSFVNAYTWGIKRFCKDDCKRKHYRVRVRLFDWLMENYPNIYEEFKKAESLKEGSK